MWDPNYEKFCAFSFFAGILLLGRIRGKSIRFHLINLYAPYRNRTPFWSRIQACGILNIRNLILMGDLNATLVVSKVWGSHIQLDPLAERISHIFTDHHFVDI